MILSRQAHALVDEFVDVQGVGTKLYTMVFLLNAVFKRWVCGIQLARDSLGSCDLPSRNEAGELKRYPLGQGMGEEPIDQNRASGTEI